MGEAARRWSESLILWGIPQEILDAAPESPWVFPVGLFTVAPGSAAPETISRSRALEALPAGGSVLDVGCGGGAAAHALVPPASRVVGVDEAPAMLEAFAEAATVDHAEVPGRWPDVEASVEICDVVVSHHVLYNVAAADAFVEALTGHARRRVVVEIYEGHPREWLNPLWLELWGLDRPSSPRAGDLLDVVRETGADAGMELWESLSSWSETLGEEDVAFIRRMLCLPADRDGDLRGALERNPPPRSRQKATIWWDV